MLPFQTQCAALLHSQVQAWVGPYGQCSILVGGWYKHPGSGHKWLNTEEGPQPLHLWRAEWQMQVLSASPSMGAAEGTTPKYSDLENISVIIFLVEASRQAQMWS